MVKAKKVISIDLDDIVKLTNDGKDFVFDEKAEDNIALLLELRDNVENAINEIKKSIEEQGVKINPSFSGVRGTKIQASYRHYGQAYKVTDHVKAEAFVTKSVSYRPNSTAIESYMVENGKIPDGIIVNNRQKVVSLKPL